MLTRKQIKQDAKNNLNSYFGYSILNLLLFDLINIGILQGPLLLGWNSFQEKIYYQEQADVSDQFSGFSHNFWKSIGLWIMVTFWVSFLTCLFIIPGIIAACAYSQSYRILLDHPESTAMNAMTQSRQLMKGHKWEYFVLNLSYIGWDLLSILTFGLLQFYIIPYREQANFIYFKELINQDESYQTASYSQENQSQEAKELPYWEESTQCKLKITNLYHRNSHLILEGNLLEGIPFYGDALMIVSDARGDDEFSQYIHIYETVCDRSGLDSPGEKEQDCAVMELDTPEDEIYIGDIVEFADSNSNGKTS